MEDKINSCPTCQATLDELGLCPRCLFANALEPTSAPANTPPAISAVALAFPDLEIIELIGAGGMGAVYKARQKSLDRLVALKLLPQSLAEDPAFAVRFHNEAKALATLNHPNIVTIHDFGQQEGFYFLLMEYVDGPNLRHLIKERHLSPEEALAIIPPLCDALQFAHDHQIVHRDIKPENLLLDTKGRIKVADFGIAKIIDHNSSPDFHASGTPAYMAPEQKDQPHAVDARSDIYSLGVVLYEMLTGERPGRILTPPSQKATLDVRIDEVVLRALNSKPDQRWQSATELQTELQNILTEPKVSPFPSSFPDSSPKKAYWACVLTLLSLLILSVALLPTKVNRESTGHAMELQAERERFQAKREQLLTEARSLDDADFAGEDHQEEQARLRKQADELQDEIDSRQRSKRPNQLVPILLTVGTLGLGVGSMLTGLILGWHHLSWLRGQSPERPALIPGLIAALLWPLLILSILVFTLVNSPGDLGKWSNVGLLLGWMSVICLDLWIFFQTLAWTKNQAYSITQNVWLLAFPLIALAIFIPVSRYDLASQQKLRESKLRLSPPSHVQYTETELQKSLRSYAKILKSGLGPDHPNVIASKRRVAVFESQLRSLGEETYRTSKHRILSNLVLGFSADLASLESQGLGPNHPDRVGVEYGLMTYQVQLDELPQPPPLVFDRTPEFSQLLPSLVVSMICVILVIILIRKACAQERGRKS